jgi:ceramide glucosyltransferase
MISAILGGLTVLSAGINLWQWAAAGRFPLRAQIPKATASVGVTLFKPLKGADDYTHNCLESWLAQDYAGPTQILFGVADPNDPVCEIVRDLISLYPHRDIELIICQPILGPNAKVSTLTYLQAKAKHPIWIVSDADVFAPESLLTEIATRFEQDPAVALVNSFYKLPAPETFGGLWESISVNADFWSQVCQSNSMQPMRFALGAVMAARREAVEKIGGYKSLLNQLADDYQLGKRIAASGGKIELTTSVVECREEAKSFAQIWAHQLRWSRTIRVCQPVPYFFSILSNTTLFAVATSLVNPFCPGILPSLLVRLATAMHNAYRLTQRRESILEAMFVPVKDLLQFVIWLLSFTGNKIVWRNETFHVSKDGELLKANP